MKTPEEIKKGLECCAKSECASCPFKDCESYDECTATLAADALDYIKQLKDIADQYRWERDVAIDQLKQLGIGFGEKINGKLLRWLSFCEAKPPKHQRVLCFGKHESEPFIYIDIALADGNDTLYAAIYKPTHWMPLPEPPKEE